MKVALVTGGSRGIGAETVKKLAQMQYTVILNYNKSVENAQKLKNDLFANGCDVHLYQADVSDVKQVAEMFAWVAKYFKKLNVLVNNAGVAFTKQLQDVSEQDFDRVMSINAKSAYFCCREALPLLQKEGGSIVNVSSIWGVEGSSCESVYSMSKHAIVGLTLSLAEELAPIGVNVNCVCPPIVQTDMTKLLTQQDIDRFAVLHNTRLYSASQVAEDIYLLATCGKTGWVFREK